MIKLTHVTKTFDSVPIIDDLDLTIGTGEFVVFSGASGAGKTTLLNLLGGLERPDSGQIIVDDRDITNRKNLTEYYRNTVSFLFQNFALIENKTVKQNLELIQKKTRTELTIADALTQVGIKELLNRKIYQLSGGEQQRVALARIMLKRSSIILADEPTGSLDAKNADVVMSILKKLNQAGKTLIVVTHDPRIKQQAERIVDL
ncbi:ABC transporter ATP-binding protein [Lapidilactobacillus luobeiensis]|uniref:ABC transporter ATP-binding protein n=1 Tax=Lapidilactobacillus luobeiensis TaxID=2950371 RepID=UPI0021C406BC|nr:ATP-binding cassette domain-containing protein [Lapidilactobacillus luobeiensis]